MEIFDIILTTLLGLLVIGTSIWIYRQGGFSKILSKDAETFFKFIQALTTLLDLFPLVYTASEYRDIPLVSSLPRYLVILAIEVIINFWFTTFFYNTFQQYKWEDKIKYDFDCKFLKKAYVEQAFVKIRNWNVIKNILLTILFFGLASSITLLLWGLYLESVGVLEIGENMFSIEFVESEHKPEFSAMVMVFSSIILNIFIMIAAYLSFSNMSVTDIHIKSEEFFKEYNDKYKLAKPREEAKLPISQPKPENVVKNNFETPSQIKSTNTLTQFVKPEESGKI